MKTADGRRKKVCGKCAEKTIKSGEFTDMTIVKGRGYGKKLPLAKLGLVEGLWFKFKKFIMALWRELKDKTNLIIFIIVMLVLSSEVWASYLLGYIFRSKALIHIGNICWLFWLGPFTPFLPLAIGITFGVRKLFDKVLKRLDKKAEKQK